jgi:hypothetical protein
MGARCDADTISNGIDDASYLMTGLDTGGVAERAMFDVQI